MVMLCSSTDADPCLGTDADFEVDWPTPSMAFESVNYRRRRKRVGATMVEKETYLNRQTWTATKVSFSHPPPPHRYHHSGRRSNRQRQKSEMKPQSNGPFEVPFDSHRHRHRHRQHDSGSRIISTVATNTNCLLRLLVVLMGLLLDPSNAFQSTRQQHQHQTRQRPSFSILSMSTTTSTSLPTKTELESMTVVNLKQLIKDSGLNERGLLSKLKRKQDLIDFLTESSSAEGEVRGGSEGAPNDNGPKPPKPSRITMPKMKPPPSEEASSTTAAASATTSEALPPDVPEGKPKQQSPMEVLFEKVNEQYPTLRYLVQGNSTICGELDIRQRYHPMLQAGNQQAIPEALSDENIEIEKSEHDERENSWLPKPKTTTTRPALSGDMDLIFVGTASCTPSITRGVSCTALRLHSLATAPKTSKTKKTKDVTIEHQGGGTASTTTTATTPRRFDVESSSSSSNLGTWLFDCGESTQLQIQKTSSVRPSKITKIFLTHAHGDHSFGLPGLLCLMGQDTAGGNEAGEKGPNGENIRKTRDSKAPIDIYGPEGLRLWLRTAIRYSVSRIVPRYRVHELKDVAMAPEWGYSPKWEKYFFNKQAFHEIRNGGSANANANKEFYWGAANDKRKENLHHPRRRGQPSDWMSLCEMGAQSIERSELYGEVEGGRDIYPIYDHPLSSDGAPVWEVEHEGGDPDDHPSENRGVRVYAAPMSHGVPCVGYVVQEADRPGRLRSELVTPICKRNVAALKNAGFRHPMKALAVIKDLPEGGSFTFPDGTVVKQEDAVEPTRPGRKIVIGGDTNSCRSLEKLAENADVVIHEATNTFLQNLDDSNINSVTRDAIYHGHSTPHMAGDFAKRVNAKRLILNHFSSRYMGDQSLESISIMTRIEQQAMKASGLSRNHVAAAWDFMIFPIPKANDKTNPDDDDDDVGSLTSN